MISTCVFYSTSIQFIRLVLYKMAVIFELGIQNWEGSIIFFFFFVYIYLVLHNRIIIALDK